MATHFVIGSGISGLIGSLLLRQKYKSDEVIIIEKNSEIGGLLKSYKYDNDIYFDHGMHNFNETNIPELNKIFYNILKDDWLYLKDEYRDLAGVYFNGRLQENSIYPDLRFLKQSLKNKIFADFFVNENLYQKLSYSSVFDFGNSRFGPVITNNIIRNSIEKIFSNKIEELHYLAAKIAPMERMVFFDLPLMREFQKIKYFREKFAFTEQKLLPLNFSSNKKSLYPKKHGTWRILNEIQKDLLNNSIKVLNNTVVESFSFKRNKIYKCKISNVLNKNTEEIEINGNILWTIGIPKLPTLFNLKLPDEKPDLPKKTVLANFITDKPIEAGELQYFHCYDPGYKTFRVNNYINYSPNAKNFLGFPVCAELLVDFNYDINNHLLDVAENELKRMGVLKKQKIVFKKLEVLEEAFPMPTLKNIRLINTMRSDIEKLNFKNLIIAGILSKENLFFQRHVLPDMYEKLFN